MSTHQLVDNVLSNSALIIATISYSIKEIYEIVENNAGLRPGDYQKEDNGDIKWKHAVRSILAKRSTSLNRNIQYHGKAKYSFF